MHGGFVQMADFISCLTQCLNASHPSLRVYDWTLQRERIWLKQLAVGWIKEQTFNPRWMRSRMMATNSRSDKRPSPSSSKSRKTVRTTCGLSSEPVQILTARWNSSAANNKSKSVQSKSATFRFTCGWGVPSEIGRSARLYMRMATAKSSRLLRKVQKTRNSWNVMPFSSASLSSRRSRYSSYLQGLCSCRWHVK